LCVGATAVFKLFAIASVENLTAPLWRCLVFSKNKLNATPQAWELIKFYTITTNGLCGVFFENRERNVLKLGIAAVLFIL